MVNIRTIDDKIYNILFRYIKEKYLGDTLFCCISGCNNKLISYIQENTPIIQKNSKEYCIIPIYEEKANFSFNEIVKIRNDKKIKKIIIFTNGSISNIDSLKDFMQIDVKKITFIDLWAIIQDECSIDWKASNNYKEIEIFLTNLTDKIQPEIYKLIEYLEEVKKDSLAYNNLILAMNTNLYKFDIWSSSCNTVLRKTKLHSIYHNSDPIQIHKKITSPRDIEKIERKANIDKVIIGRYHDLGRQKKILKDMFYERKYSEAYKEIYYELIEDVLKGSGKKQNKKNDQEENTYTYTNTYNLALTVLTEIDKEIEVNIDEIKALTSFDRLDFDSDIHDKEDEGYNFTVSVPFTIKNENINTTKDIVINLEEAKVKWEQFRSIFDHGYDGHDIIDGCQNLNIHSEDKVILCNSVREYLNARNDFRNNNNNPIRFNKLLDNSMLYVTAFFQLIKVLYSFEQSTIENIAISGLLNKLVNIDIEIQNNKIYVPYYSPLLIFHMHNMKNRYEKCLSLVKEMNTHRIEILEQINTKILNEHIAYDGNTYLLSKDNNDFPYYIKYMREKFVDSIIKINLNIITPYILKYIRQNPYKNVLKLCLIGEVDFKSLKNALLKILTKTENTNLRYFKLKIITKSPNDVKEVLISLFEQKESLNKKIECTIEKLNENSNLEEYVGNLISENDITMLLDSSIMYLKTRFNKKRDKDFERAVNYRDISSEINSISYVLAGTRDNMPITPNIINVLQNSIISEDLQHGELEKYRLNVKLISIINEILKETPNNDKEVILLSSDSNIDEQILDNHNLIKIEEAININDKIKILTFCKSGINKEKYKFDNDTQYIEFTASDLIDSFAINDRLEFSSESINYEEVIIRISYEKFPQIIKSVYCTEKYDEEINMKINSQCIDMYNMFIKVSIKPNLFLDYYDRATFVKLLLKSAKTEEDIVFIYSFENSITDVEVDYDGHVGQGKQKEITAISSINRNTIYRMLNFLGEEGISEQSMKSFIEMLKKNNFKEENLPMLYKLISKYNHKELKYLHENISAVLKNLEVK